MTVENQHNSQLDTIWDIIVAHGIATDEELQLVTYINGYNEQALNDVLYVRTGYRDIEQYLADNM